MQVMWKTEQKDSNNMINPKLDNKVDFETNNLVYSTSNTAESSVKNVIEAKEISDVQRKMSKRSVQLQDKESSISNTNDKKSILNDDNSTLNETKPKTFKDIINEFYRSSITYMWHFFKNPKIFDTSKYCNSQPKPDACDVKLEEVVHDNKDDKNLYVVPNSLLQTKTTECVITASYDDKLNHKVLCRLILSDDTLIPRTFDFKNFTNSKRSLLETKETIKNKGIFEKTIIDGEYYFFEDVLSNEESRVKIINDAFKNIYSFLYKNLAENNSTNQNFIPQNTKIIIYLNTEYNKNITLNIQTYGEKFMLSHDLYSKIHLEHDYDQNMKDALKEVEAVINATNTTKNEKMLVTMSTLISLLIARFVIK
ncbi:hypothetical protein BDAP_000817 [Binucleata daphniae]